MVPKLHKKGRSFKGAAQYLLHDKGADTSERVAWAQTRNLITDNPDVAWRVMAATAMDQDRLKQQAGVKNTGRKSNLHAQHFTLSWHESEADDLDRDAMVAAAESALAALGAQDRQAIIVSHNDEPHPHVHILLNRVGDDGRMLSSSKEKLALSEWAETYEKERGRIWCDERVINNAARRRGEYTRGVPSKARHLYEAQQLQVSNDNAAKPVRDEQKQKDAELSQVTRKTEAKQAVAWAKIEQQHKQRVRGIRQDTKQSIQHEQEKVRENFRRRWAALHHEQQAAMRDFEKRESTLLGRMHNRFKAIDLPRLIGTDNKRKVIGETFDAVASKAGRLEAHQRKQRTAEDALKREQRRAEAQAAQQQKQLQQQRLNENRLRFQSERTQLSLEQQMDRAKLRAKWLERHKERKQTVQGLEPAQALRHDQKQDKTKPDDLLPKKDAGQAAKQINEHQKGMRRRTRRRKRDNDRER